MIFSAGCPLCPPCGWGGLSRDWTPTVLSESSLLGRGVEIVGAVGSERAAHRDRQHPGRAAAHWLESTAGLLWIFELAGLSWTLLTFFVLPVIVVEGGGLLTSLRRPLALGRRELGSWIAGGIRLFVTTLLVLAAGVIVMISNESDSVAVSGGCGSPSLSRCCRAGYAHGAGDVAERLPGHLFTLPQAA